MEGDENDCVKDEIVALGIWQKAEADSAKMDSGWFCWKDTVDLPDHTENSTHKSTVKSGCFLICPSFWLSGTL